MAERTPERARLVTGGTDNAPPVGRRSDDDRPATQSRVVALFDRSVKRIHIEVKNDAGHAQGCRIGGFGPGVSTVKLNSGALTRRNPIFTAP